MCPYKSNEGEAERSSVHNFLLIYIFVLVYQNILEIKFLAAVLSISYILCYNVKHTN